MKYKILVIDDDKSILRLVRNVLESKNFVVDTLTSIPDIDICHFIGYDLIILDIMMPHSGIEICRYIREFISVPIIFLTAKIWKKMLYVAYSLVQMTISQSHSAFQNQQQEYRCISVEKYAIIILMRFYNSDRSQLIKLKKNLGLRMYMSPLQKRVPINFVTLQQSK